MLRSSVPDLWAIIYYVFLIEHMVANNSTTQLVEKQTKMLYLNCYFENFEEFKKRFGVVQRERTDGRITSERKNKTELAFVKAVFKNRKDLLGLDVTNYTHIVSKLTVIDRSLILPFLRLGSNKYRTDNMNGLCDDGDANSIRYENIESGRIFKMKAGKLFRAVCIENGIDKIIGETVLNYYCELFSLEWKAYDTEQMPKHRLVVDDDFSSSTQGLMQKAD